MAMTWARPLRRQLLLAILLLLAPILAAGVWLGVVEYRETVEELTELTELTARRTAAAVERELTGLDRMARNMASHPMVQNLDAAAVDLLQPQRLQRPSLIDLVLVDRSGQLVARAGSSAEIGDNWSELMQRVIHKNSRVVSQLHVQSSGLVYVAVTYPLYDDDKVTGALAYYVDPGLLQEAFREPHLPPGSVITLTETGGRVLVRYPDPERYVGRVMEVDFHDAPEPPTEHTGVDGMRRMFGQAMVAGGPWVVTVGIPTSVALDR
ncbi:MAG: cache domain-containing protein, partial [Vicinamibacterales bacterium]